MTQNTSARYARRACPSADPNTQTTVQARGQAHPIRQEHSATQIGAGGADGPRQPVIRCAHAVSSFHCFGDLYSQNTRGTGLFKDVVGIEASRDILREVTAFPVHPSMRPFQGPPVQGTCFYRAHLHH